MFNLNLNLNLKNKIIGGWISFKFGGRNVIAVSMFLSGLFTILTPVCSKWSWIALAINRLIVGATHVSKPSILIKIFCFFCRLQPNQKIIWKQSINCNH